MKHLFYFTISSFCILSCSKTETLTQGSFRIKSMEYIDRLQSQFNNTFEFYYDEYGREKEIIDNFNQQYYSYSYKNNQLQTIEKISTKNNKLKEKREFEYDNKNKIKTVYVWVLNQDSIYALNNDIHFTYSNTGRLTETQTYHSNSSFKEIYTWQNSDIVEIKEYNNNKLWSVTTLKYDNKPNFKTNSAFFDQYYDHLNLNAHNLIYWEVDNFERNAIIDYYCNPCQYDIFYNGNNLPVQIIQPRHIINIKYEKF